MSQIPENIIEEVLSKADIESVVGHYVQFTKRTGSNLFGLCPFHSEKTGSFSVSIQKGIYYCFGCHKGGNAIGFIMDIEHLSYPEAIRYLGKQYGVEIPESTNDYQYDNTKKIKERVKQILLETAKYYYKSLLSSEGKEAREYLSNRQLSKETCTKFGLGFAPKGFDRLKSHLTSLGYSEDEMKNSGLFTVSKNGKLVDLFRGRLMFPIFDSFGTVVAFGGRCLGDDLPKYINSPESVVYKKQEHLYALNFAKKERSERLIIVEGYMDAISMHQAGVCNAVASLATAFTDGQLRLSSKYASEIVFFFDSDNAGQNAALRAISMMLKYSKKMSGLKLRIRIAKVPDGKDPDGFIKEHGAKAFEQVVENALDVDRYLSDRAYNNSFSDNGLDLYKYEEDIVTYGSWISDDVKRNRMASKAAIYLKANPSVIYERMNEISNKEAEKEAAVDARTIQRQKKDIVSDRNSNDYDEDVSESDINESSSLGVEEVSSKEPAIPKDAAYLEELNLFVLAMKLKGALADESIIRRDECLRPMDFVGNNMKQIVSIFLENFVPGSGVNEAILINILSKFSLNGEPAESLYLKVDSSFENMTSFEVIRSSYLLQLYKIRRNNLRKERSKAIELLDSTTGSDRERIIESIKQIDAYLEHISAEEILL